MIEKNLKTCNKFINKLFIKIEDLNNNVTLLSKVDKKIFKNIINQTGGSNLIQSINIDDLFINKIFIKIKDLKNNFTLLSKVNKIILKNIINQQGGAIDMYNINYAFLNLTKQKELLKKYNENIKKLNDLVDPMYKILNKTFPNIVVFFDTLTNILGYKNKNKNTHTFKQIIKDDLPDLEKLIYELIEKNKLSFDNHQRLIQIIGDKELLEFFPITEDTKQEHTIRERITEPAQFPFSSFFTKGQEKLYKDKRGAPGERVQELIEQAKAAEQKRKETAAKAAAAQEHINKQKVLRAEQEQKAAEIRLEEERKLAEEGRLKAERILAEVKRQPDEQVRRDIPELSQESIREIKEELKQKLTNEQIDKVIEEASYELEKLNDFMKLLTYENGFNINKILVKTPREPDYNPSEDEINEAYKILEDSFTTVDYYKTDSTFLHNFFASINYVIYDKYYNKDPISSRNEFLLTMKKNPLINIISTIFDNMHTGVRDKYIALKKAYKNYSDLSHTNRLRSSPQRDEAHIKALEYIKYRQNIRDIKITSKKNMKNIKLNQETWHLALNKINIQNADSQTPDSDAKLTQIINQLNFVDNLVFFRRDSVKYLLILLAFNTICSFKIKKDDLVKVYDNKTYIDNYRIPSEVDKKINNEKNKQDIKWIYWINCVIYNMGCNWNSGCLYPKLYPLQ